MRILVAALVVLAGATTALGQTYTPSYGGGAMKAWYGGQSYAAEPYAQKPAPYAMSDRGTVVPRGKVHVRKHRTRTPR